MRVLTQDLSVSDIILRRASPRYYFDALTVLVKHFWRAYTFPNIIAMRPITMGSYICHYL